MSIYLSSDWHLTHENITKYANRFCDYKEYSNILINKIREKMTEDDILIFMGDLDCGPLKNIEDLKRFISLIPGKKVFVRGNHDYWLDDESIYYIGFSEITDIIREKNTIICHYPLDKCSSIPKQAPQFLKNYDLTGIKRIYHGHIHNNYEVPKFSDDIERINCCVDRVPSEVGDLILFEAI